jgi:hypothetical protein
VQLKVNKLVAVFRHTLSLSTFKFSGKKVTITHIYENSKMGSAIFIPFAALKILKKMYFEVWSFLFKNFSEGTQFPNGQYIERAML